MSTLFMVQLGARPKGRLIEQHDIFFGLADKIADLIPAINAYWPEVKNKWHIDSFRAVTNVVGTDGNRYKVSWKPELVNNPENESYTQTKTQVNSSSIIEKNESKDASEDKAYEETKENIEDNEHLKLFFINLGGYQQGSIEEFHYKMLVVAPTQSAAMKHARQTEFYKSFSYNDEDTNINGASHIDDKMQVDVDEIYEVNGLLAAGRIVISPLNGNLNEGMSDSLDVSFLDRAQVSEDKDYVGYLNIKKLKSLEF